MKYSYPHIIDIVGELNENYSKQGVYFDGSELYMVMAFTLVQALESDNCMPAVEVNLYQYGTTNFFLTGTYTNIIKIE